MIPVILHVDMDAFFVSVEELYDGSLRGKPVIVGGRPNQRGVVAAASYAARRFGVHSAMPLTRAALLCPQAIFLPVHRERYQEASEQIREIFLTFSPQVEMVSVDEAYLNLSGSERLLGSPLRAASLLHEEIASKVHLPSSIGISSFRVVSKIASDQAKPNGILWVMPGREAAFLAPLPVGKIPGVGKVTEKNLRLMGIRTIGDIERWRASAAPEQVRSVIPQLGSLFSATLSENNAVGPSPEKVDWDEDDWEDEGHAKSIGHEETFGEDISDEGPLETVLADLSQRVAARLREHGLYARTITLKLRYSSFQTITRAETLPESTNLDGVILTTAHRLFKHNWNRRQKIRLLGVQASGLSSQAGQGNLLTASTEGRWSRALSAADKLRRRFGFSSVQLASALSPATTPAEQSYREEGTGNREQPETLPSKSSAKRPR